MDDCNCRTAPSSCGCGDKLPAPGAGLQLAIATIPMQLWETLYEPGKALKQGTVFPSLDLPFFVTGGGSNG